MELTEELDEEDIQSIKRTASIFVDERGNTSVDAGDVVLLCTMALRLREVERENQELSKGVTGWMEAHEQQKENQCLKARLRAVEKERDEARQEAKHYWRWVHALTGADKNPVVLNKLPWEEPKP